MENFLAVHCCFQAVLQLHTVTGPGSLLLCNTYTGKLIFAIHKKADTVELDKLTCTAVHMHPQNHTFACQHQVPQPVMMAWCHTGSLCWRQHSRLHRILPAWLFQVGKEPGEPGEHAIGECQHPQARDSRQYTGSS